MYFELYDGEAFITFDIVYLMLLFRTMYPNKESRTINTEITLRLALHLVWICRFQRICSHTISGNGTISEQTNTR